MVNPEDFLDDQERLLREGEQIDDDILRGACPFQAVPWISAMLGSELRILPGNILSEEKKLPWDQVESARLDPENPWYRLYFEFADALIERAEGRFPISHGMMHGPTDLLADFRGHTQSMYDLVDNPDSSRKGLERYAEAFIEITEAIWRVIPLFHGGYYDAQYQLWAPGPITRLQEDAAAVYSPSLYRDLVQDLDRKIAGHFPSAFMHLHSTSMFLLNEILEIEELGCLQVNYEVNSGGPDIHGMMPYFQSIQRAGRSLLIRGSFTTEEARALMDSLDPAGLYIYIMVKDMKEIEALRPRFGM